jgi:hypothetical protein
MASPAQLHHRAGHDRPSRPQHSMGFRLHARAGCARDGIFEDFVLARMSGTGGTRPTAIDPADDAWHRHVRVILVHIHVFPKDRIRWLKPITA